VTTFRRTNQIVVSSPRDSTMSDVENRPADASRCSRETARGSRALAQSRSNNEKLTITIQQTRDQIAALRDEVEKLTQPPAVYGTFIDFNDDAPLTYSPPGARCGGAPPGASTRPDRPVMRSCLNESFTVIGVRESDARVRCHRQRGAGRTARPRLRRADEERVVELADSLPT